MCVCVCAYVFLFFGAIEADEERHVSESWEEEIKIPELSLFSYTQKAQ